MAMPLMASCSPIQVNDSCPAPRFPSCSTMQRVIKNNDPKEKQDWVSILTIMLQLRDRQEKGEQDEFGSCTAPASK